MTSWDACPQRAFILIYLKTEYHGLESVNNSAAFYITVFGLNKYSIEDVQEESQSQSTT